MKKLWLIPLIVVLLTAFIFTGCASQAPAPAPKPARSAPAPAPAPAPVPAPAPKPVTPQPTPPPPTGEAKVVLKAVSFQAKTATVLKLFVQWMNAVNDKKGQVTINWVGGGEVVAAFDQGSAVSTGVVDISVLPSSYFQQLAPAVFGACILSQSTPMDEYKNGIYDFMVGEAAKAGLRFVGRVETNQTFHIGVKKPVTTPADLKGKKIRTAALYNFFLTALGCAAVTIPQPEVYTALERGVVDGYAFPFSNVSDLSLFEVCKYFIDHTMYESGNLVVIINQKTFNALPKDSQDLLLKTMQDLEPSIYASFGDGQAAAKKIMLDKGMTAIKFSAEDAKSYRDLAYKSFAEGVAKTMPADTFTKMMGLISAK